MYREPDHSMRNDLVQTESESTFFPPEFARKIDAKLFKTSTALTSAARLSRAYATTSIK